MNHPGPASTLDAVDARLLEGVLNGQRRALAKAITLIESTRSDQQLRARNLVEALLPHTGNAIRLGISGSPGVGKSTFIEAFGMFLIERGHRVAVLAVDPSSSVTGGSILGDKTRMERLTQSLDAFIRPSPSSGTLGGVARKTREAMLACEAAGFDVIIVETVGVGQSETAVAGMTDAFVLLQHPNAGDELQAIKKGVVELADLIVINKADTDPKAAALARSQIRSALTMLRHSSPTWRPPVITLSALDGKGIAEFWDKVSSFRDTLSASGEFAAKRRNQARAWMWALIEDGLRDRFRHHPQVRARLTETECAVEEGRRTPSAAATQLLGFLGD